MRRCTSLRHQLDAEIYTETEKYLQDAQEQLSTSFHQLFSTEPTASGSGPGPQPLQRRKSAAELVSGTTLASQSVEAPQRRKRYTRKQRKITEVEKANQLLGSHTYSSSEEDEKDHPKKAARPLVHSTSFSSLLDDQPPFRSKPYAGKGPIARRANRKHAQRLAERAVSEGRSSNLEEKRSMSVRDLNGIEIDFTKPENVTRWASQIFAELDSLPSSRVDLTRCGVSDSISSIAASTLPSQITDSNNLFPSDPRASLTKRHTILLSPFDENFSLLNNNRISASEMHLPTVPSAFLTSSVNRFSSNLQSQLDLEAISNDRTPRASPSLNHTHSFDTSQDYKHDFKVEPSHLFKPIQENGNFTMPRTHGIVKPRFDIDNNIATPIIHQPPVPAPRTSKSDSPPQKTTSKRSEIQDRIARRRQNKTTQISMDDVQQAAFETTRSARPSTPILELPNRALVVAPQPIVPAPVAAPRKRGSSKVGDIENENVATFGSRLEKLDRIAETDARLQSSINRLSESLYAKINKKPNVMTASDSAIPRVEMIPCNDDKLERWKKEAECRARQAMYANSAPGEKSVTKIVHSLIEAAENSSSQTRPKYLQVTAESSPGSPNGVAQSSPSASAVSRSSSFDWINSPTDSTVERISRRKDSPRSSMGARETLRNETSEDDCDAEIRAVTGAAPTKTQERFKESFEVLINCIDPQPMHVSPLKARRANAAKTTKPELTMTSYTSSFGSTNNKSTTLGTSSQNRFRSFETQFMRPRKPSDDDVMKSSTYDNLPGEEDSTIEEKRALASIVNRYGANDKRLSCHYATVEKSNDYKSPLVPVVQSPRQLAPLSETEKQKLIDETSKAIHWLQRSGHNNYVNQFKQRQIPITMDAAISGDHSVILTKCIKSLNESGRRHLYNEVLGHMMPSSSLHRARSVHRSPVRQLEVNHMPLGTHVPLLPHRQSSMLSDYKRDRVSEKQRNQNLHRFNTWTRSASCNRQNTAQTDVRKVALPIEADIRLNRIETTKGTSIQRSHSLKDRARAALERLRSGNKGRPSEQFESVPVLLSYTASENEGARAESTPEATTPRLRTKRTERTHSRESKRHGLIISSPEHSKNAATLPIPKVHFDSAAISPLRVSINTSAEASVHNRPSVHCDGYFAHENCAIAGSESSLGGLGTTSSSTSTASARYLEEKSEDANNLRRDSGVGSSVSRSPSGPTRRGNPSGALGYRAGGFLGNEAPLYVPDPFYDEIDLCRTWDSLNAVQLSYFRNKASATLLKYVNRNAEAQTQTHGFSRVLKKIVTKFRHEEQTNIITIKGNVYGISTLDLQRNSQGLPHTILELVHVLLEASVEHAGIFRKSGVRSRVTALRNKLDCLATESLLPDISSELAHDGGDALKQFVRSFPEPLLGHELLYIFRCILKDESADQKNKEDETYISLTKEAEAVGSSNEQKTHLTNISAQHSHSSVLSPEQHFEAVRAFLLLLPDSSRQIIITMFTFLREFSAINKYGAMTLRNLATCFAPSLFNLLSDSDVGKNRRKTVSVGAPTAQDMQKHLAAVDALEFILANLIPLTLIDADEKAKAPTIDVYTAPGKEIEHLAMLCENISKERGRNWYDYTRILYSPNPTNINLFYKQTIATDPTESQLPITVVASGVVQATPDAILQSFISNRKAIDSSIIHFDIVPYGDITKVHYVQRQQYGHPTRDYLCYSHCFNANGTIVLVERSLPKSISENLMIGGVRALVFMYGVLIQPSAETESNVHLIQCIDLGGHDAQFYSQVFPFIVRKQLLNLQSLFRH